MDENGAIPNSRLRYALDMRVVALGFLCLAACGRVDFALLSDGATDGDAATGEEDGAPGDAATACTGFDLCESFEAAVGAAWTVEPGVAIDNTVFHRGQRSARMHMPALATGQSGSARMSETATLTPTPPETWVRAYFFVNALPAASNRLEMVSLEHDGGGGAAEYLFSRDTSFEMYLEPSGTTSATAQAPVGEWFCVVFHVVFSTTSGGSLELISDRIPYVMIGAMKTNDSVAPIDTIGVGPYFAGPNVLASQPAFDVWVDDVIVHHAPVTCAD